MTGPERKRCYLAYVGLCSAFQHKIDKAEYEVYQAVLEPMPVEAVETAALEIARGGSTDHWFPRAPEWFALASEVAHVRPFTQPTRPRHGWRELAPATIALDLVRIRATRAALIVDLKAKGYNWAAAYIEALPVNHPSLDPLAPYCETCSDSGLAVLGGAYDDDDPTPARCVAPCDCVEQNPAVAARRQAARHTELVRARRRRLAELQPGRKQLSTGG